MSVQKIATRYAKSLVDLAREQGKLDRVAEDIRHFAAVSRVRDFELLLKSPIVKPDKKEKIFHELFAGKYDPMSFGFLRIILKKGRESYLAEIAKAFLDQYDEINKISRMKLVTASVMKDEQLEKIRKEIRNADIAYPNIELETEVDPEIIGGFVLEFEDKLYDASVAFQLEQMRKELTSKKS